ncbi:thioredoxin family protein [Akkermansiaceae bacterium]|nr:thioredoxin family protein [Akkermansiaceae bacterium]
MRHQSTLYTSISCVISVSYFFSSPLLAEESTYELKLTEGSSKSSLRPEFNPRGTKIPLTLTTDTEGLDGYDHIQGRVPLRTANPQDILLARSEKNGAYDLLFVDSDLDGKITNKELLKKGEISQSRSGSWRSSFGAAFFSQLAEVDNLPKEGDFSSALWTSTPKKNATPDFIYFSGKGFTIGHIDIDGAQYDIIVYHINNDGIITESDYWNIKCTIVKERSGRSRKINDFCWANGKAWTISLNDPKGNSIVLKQKDVGMTQLEDEDSRNPWSADTKAVKATKPVSFFKDYKKAKAASVTENKPLIIKFETSWCGPCHMMNRLVFIQQQVVDAASDFIWVKIDGDASKDLVEKYNVKAYPTFIALQPDSTELKRFGTSHGKELVTILGELIINKEAKY